MYVDESGDSGIPGTTPRFVLIGLVLHELRWHDALNDLLDFRRSCRTKYRLKLRDEIHAGRMFSRPGKELAGHGKTSAQEPYRRLPSESASPHHSGVQLRVTR